MIVPPQASVNAPSTPVTVPLPSQLSVHAKSVIAGTSPTHSTVTAKGAAAKTGAVISSIVKVWVHSAVLPQASVAR